MFNFLNSQAFFTASAWIAVPLGLFLFLILSSPRNKGKHGLKALSLVSLGTFILFAIVLKSAPKIWAAVAPYSSGTGFITFMLITQLILDAILIGEVILALSLKKK